MSLDDGKKLKLLDVLLSKTNNYMAVIDLEGKYLYINPSLTWVLNKESGTTSILNNIHSEDKEIVIKFLKEVLEQGQNVSEEYRILDKENKVHYLKSYGELLGKNDTEAQNMVIISNDLTSQKELKQEIKKLKTIIEQSSDEVVITNKEGIVEYVNKSFEKDTGYSKEEAIGKTIRKLLSGKNDQKFYDDVWGKITAGQCFHGEVINKIKTGEYVSMEKKITPITDKNGNITHFISTSKIVESEG